MKTKSQKPPQNPSAKKRIIRRRPQKPGSPDRPPMRMYFNEDTQKSICQYQSCTDPEEKKKIYSTNIYPAFDKLVENLINIHKFSGLHDTFDDLKHDCISFLFETLGKFDPTRGTKAFSYFNVVAKNWLIIKTKTKSLKVKKSVSLDDYGSLTLNELKMIDEFCVIPSQEKELENKNIAQEIVERLYQVRNLMTNEMELKCANSIITIFENVNDLDILNRQAILIYIRELTGISQKQLMSVMSVIKSHYARLKYESDLESYDYESESEVDIMGEDDFKCNFDVNVKEETFDEEGVDDVK
jgi:hypothetical protein